MPARVARPARKKNENTTIVYFNDNLDNKVERSFLKFLRLLCKVLFQQSECLENNYSSLWNNSKPVV